jgi:hypothetical protein
MAGPSGYVAVQQNIPARGLFCREIFACQKYACRASGWRENQEVESVIEPVKKFPSSLAYPPAQNLAHPKPGSSKE